MQKRVPIMIAAVLTACGAVATTSNDSAESAPQKGAKAKQTPQVGPNRYDQGGMAGCFDPRLSGQARTAAERIGGVPCERSATAESGAGGGDWVGEYRGPFDGANGVVTISRTSAGLSAEVAMFSDHGCGGSVSAPARVELDRLTLIKSGDEGPQCRIVMTRSGDHLDVSESGCTYFHGRSCEFNGRVMRVRATSPSSAGAALPERRSSILGSWATSLSECQGTSGITFFADGSFDADGTLGTWNLTGQVLTLVLRKSYTLGEEPTPLPKPIVQRQRAVSAGPDRMSVDGVMLERCPAT